MEIRSTGFSVSERGNDAGPLQRTAPLDQPCVRDALAAALEPLLPELNVQPGDDAAVLADEILSCLDGPLLDFAKLSWDAAELVAKLPPAAWDAFQRKALEKSDVGISGVRLPDNMAYCMVSYPPTLLEGLSRLGGLRSLSVPAPHADVFGMIDLRGLQCGNRQMPAVEIRCHSDSPIEVKAPAGTEVYGTARFVAAQKSRVIYYDEGAHPVGERALGGVIYDRRARDFETGSGPGLLAQNAARSTNGNGEAEFVQDRSAKLMDPDIVCADLAPGWMDAREDHRLKNDGLPFSLRKFVTSQALAENVSPDNRIKFAALMQAGAQALLDVGRFGDVLALEFANMGANETRQFAMTSPNHVLAFELRTKQHEEAGNVRTDYVVNFYDPNLTAMHERLRVDHPDQLRGRPLDNWVSANRMVKYFSAAPNPRIAGIYRWPASAPHPSRDTEALLMHVPVEHRSSPEFLHWALAEGLADHVAQSVSDALTTAPHSAAAAAHLAARCLGREGLAFAMQCGRTAAVEAYVRAVLGASDQILDSDTKVSLLDRMVRDAFRFGHAETAASFARLVASSRALDARQKLKLLQARSTGSGPTRGPTLSVIASAQQLQHRGPNLVRQQHEATFAYLREIVACGGLSDDDKGTLCAAMYGTSTAARIALANNNPGAAAAMMCAVCTHTNPEVAAQLLGRLAVAPADVLLALAGSDEAEDLRWGRQVLSSLRGIARPEIVDEMELKFPQFSREPGDSKVQ